MMALRIQRGTPPLTPLFTTPHAAFCVILFGARSRTDAWVLAGVGHCLLINLPSASASQPQKPTLMYFRSWPNCAICIDAHIGPHAFGPFERNTN
jgi:hypothetical protein